jgi:glycosyltransferase involved in cell wall biosynthesis
MNKGISFIVRIRDEEDTLYESIHSLKSLTIPHEIILVLHLCTDSSPEIATKLSEENPNVKILTYDKEISRAGYETLATNEDSEHSFVTYLNWCLKHAKYPWIFKWDADFMSTPSLLKFLNEKTWEKEKIDYKITHKNDDAQDKEYYLLGSLLKYVKHMFWEVPLMTQGRESIVLNDDIYIQHISAITKLKKYWEQKPWFEKEDSEEARIVKNRIEQLNKDFGIEPKGMARCCNPECNSYYINIMKQKPNYVNLTA